MHSLRNRFLHVAVLALIVAGALIVGAMRPTSSSAFFAIGNAITVGGITIPQPDQKDVFCIQDDRYPHSYLQFVVGPRALSTGLTNANIGQWAFVKCTGSGGTAENGYPQVGESKINAYAGALDFWGQGTQPNVPPINSYNRYDTFLADNNTSAYSLYRTYQNMTFYPGPFQQGGVNFNALFWPNVRIAAAVDSNQFNNFEMDKIRSGEAFFRPFSGGPTYHIFDSNIDDATDPNSGPGANAAVGNYSDYSRQWQTTCTCP